MKGIRRSYYYLSLFVDMTVLVLSFAVSDLISRSRLPEGMRLELREFSLPEIFTVLVFLVVWYFSARATGLYDELKNFNFSSEILDILKNVLIQMVAGVILLFSLKNILLSRFFLLVYLVLLFFTAVTARSIYRAVRRILIGKGKTVKNILVAGSGSAGLEIFGRPGLSRMTGYHLAGYVADNPEGKGLKLLGGFGDIPSVLERNRIDEVLITLHGQETAALDRILKTLSGFPVRVRIVPEYSRFVSNRYQVNFINHIPLIDIRNDPLDELHWRILKRMFDIAFSGLFLLLVFSWMFPLIAAAIKFNSRGPVFFMQERWGRKNRKFTLLKFRSMVRESRDLDSGGKFQQAVPGDARVTAVGRFLRRTSLDEIPQFINVLMGDMSVVGPRPHAVPMNMESKDKIENYMLRHLVKPGITGWAQVNGLRGATTDAKLLEQRIGHDMFYIENWSFWLDLKIIFMTVWKGFRGDPHAY